ncbi:unnamed protein product, partial [Didymodactylos carnosus]
DNNEQQAAKENRVTSPPTTTTTIIHSSNGLEDDIPTFDLSMDCQTVGVETVASKGAKDDNEDGQKFPNVYVIPDLPTKIQRMVNKQETYQFRGHSNARRLLLDAIFTDVTVKYSLLYPNTIQYKSMTKAILKLLNIQNAKEAQEEWTESLKSKFKRERHPLQETYEEVQKMKMKYGNTSGRPIKRRTNEVAPRREVNIIQIDDYMKKMDDDDDHQDIDKNIQLMKNELGQQSFSLDNVKVLWRKTLAARRLYVSNHTTKEVLQEYPGYRHIALIFDEIQYLCRVNIDENVTTMLPKLFQNMSDNSGYVTELLTIRLIKLLSKHFTDSWEYILTEKEPLSPRPTIQVITDKFRIFLDYELITETTSVDRALAAIISVYVVFDLQFGAHNRTIHLLYGVLLQEPAALTKQLRNLLIEWKFKIKHKELRQVAMTVSTIERTQQNTTTNLVRENEDQTDNQTDDNGQETFTTIRDKYPASEEENGVPTLTLSKSPFRDTTTTCTV